MIKAIIFDLNGVFIQSERLSDRFSKDYNVKTEDFLPVLSEIMAKVRQPNAGNLFKYWKPYLDQWHANLSESQFYDYWFNAETENKDLVGLAAELKGKGIKIIILSNNFKERTNYYLQTFPDLFKMFDRVYFSWQTGFVKPDPRAFDLLFSENSLKPEECLYSDDGEKNAELGNSLGIKSYIFTNAAGVANLL